MVQFDEARQLMDEMMKATIFHPSEKRRMLEDDRKTFLDPNLIMDARHRIFREELCKSSSKAAILAEARKYKILTLQSFSHCRLLTQEETKEQQLKREQALVERELRKFEQDLQKYHPKCCGPYACSKKTIASSSDEGFWKIPSRAGEKVKFIFLIQRIVVNKRRCKTAERKVAIVKKRTFAEVSESKDSVQPSINEIEGAPFGTIKVTIKDKPSCESEERRSLILRSCFDILRENARDKRRLREIKINIQDIMTRRRLRRCIRVWRTHVENLKRARREEHAKANTRDSDARKIDTLIGNIVEMQKEMTKCRKMESKDFSPSGARDANAKKRIPSCKPFVVESPAQNRLNAQKEIIRKQRMKLAEQSKLIEDLKLKQVQEEITKSGEQTVNAAKETLMHCGQQTRRTLIQLMRQAGYRDKSLTAPLRVPSPPQFLARMEARAEARRNRVKSREEARRKKLEDERRQEEAARRGEERERRRSQLEAQREARRMREERERQRAREVERYEKLNAAAEAFYRKHLLRRYVMQPFVALVERKTNNIGKANDHYERRLLGKAFAGWRLETERQSRMKIELAASLYDRNISWCMLQRWRGFAMEEKRKEQVAKDFSDMRLQNKCFELWKIRSVEYKAERLRSERMASGYYEEKLKIKYFYMWRRYPKIAPDIAESERVKNTWREIVQEVVPDFDPRQRGVLIED
ncbi:PREDICTED: calponin homology domain-containing protein DDB_G0272472 [Dinoponera quadriceps]|uniref:Calponin homology domain-containing protein DDB_G0272472 n=1 Tax=Dinoponera quadriceps TaxID=609295 RepID=A0A6P3WQ94_DINQU|nr:PREDICTED: calponin homology domain-containing protein DDB_G0272472 [Dinoponera quadriceps]